MATIQADYIVPRYTNNVKIRENPLLPDDPNDIATKGYVTSHNYGSFYYRGTFSPSGGVYPVATTLGEFWIADDAGTVMGQAYLAGDWAMYNGVSFDYVANSSLTTWPGSTAITILGTITQGTWSASVISSTCGGSGTVNGILKANGSGVITAASAGSDYLVPSSNSYYTGSNTFAGFVGINDVTSTWNGAPIPSTCGGSGNVLGILKANGLGVVTAAVADADFISVGSNTTITGQKTFDGAVLVNAGTWHGNAIGSSYGGAGTVSGLLKANGSGVVSAAVADVDYVNPSTVSTISGAKTFSSNVVISSTTASVSSTTGSVVTAGGIGVSGTSYLGGVLNITNTTASSTSTTGSVVTAGGVGIVGGMYVGGVLNVTNTTASASSTTGSVVTAGGIGVSGTSYLGGVLNITNTTASASSTTGSVVTAGGIGVSGASYLGGILNVTNTTASSTSTTGSVVTAGGVGIVGGVYVGGVLNVTNTTASASSTTGSVVTAGGIGVSGTSYLGGVLNITNTTASASSTTGSVVTAGGIGVAGTSYFGANTIASGTASANHVIATGGRVTLQNGSFAGYAECGTTGNLVLACHAASEVILAQPVWDDLSALATIRFSNSAPSYQPFITIGTGGTAEAIDQIAFAQSTSEVSVSFQIQTPHNMVPDSMMKPHMHWASSTAMSTNRAVFGLSWEIRDIGGTFTGGALGPFIYSSTITFPADNLNVAKTHYISDFTPQTPVFGTTLPSKIILGKLKRFGNDSYSGNIFLLGLDFHILKDKINGAYPLP